jgi:hypothetical protein
VVEESNSQAEKNRRDIDGDFVEQAGVQALLDGVSTVDPDGLAPTLRCGFRRPPT